MRHASVPIFVPHVGCPHRCSFCDQRTISGQSCLPTPQEVEKICEEALQHLGKRAQNSEIAFFGGSFTAIDREYMISLLQTASAFVGPTGFGGIRLSTRPDAVEEEVLLLLKDYGVTAIELGAQSMDDRVLFLNERGHTALQVEESARRIKDHGFSLGLQMMVGLYGDTLSGAYETAKHLADLEPDTVRIYPVAVIQGTKLAQWWQEGRYHLPTFDESVECCAKLLLFFERRGISVIRMGLHASRELEKEMVAGLYHPAFREICQGRIYYNNAVEALENENLDGDVVLYVPLGRTSQMAGQKRENIRRLAALGYRVKIRENSSLEEYQVKVEKFTSEGK